MDLNDAVSLLTESPAETGIFTDFDGTLSEIVELPHLARPADGAGTALVSLAEMFRVVAIVSGRSLEQLRARFAPEGVVLAGSYGRERSDSPVSSAQTQTWEAVGTEAGAATEHFPGVVVEVKGAGVALHWRLAPEHEPAVREVAGDLGRKFALDVRPGRKVVELVTPGPGKADAIEGIAGDYGIRTLMFAGDDEADLEAFHRIKKMPVRSVLVAVPAAESPPDLEAAADLVLSGPDECVNFLQRIGEAVNAPA